MQINRYTTNDQQAWDAFVRSAKNGLFLLERGFMDYHADRFTDYSLIVRDEKENIIALLPANERDGVLYSHQGLTFGGFVTDSSMKAAKMLEIFAALELYAAQHKLQKLIYKAIPHTYHRYPAEEDLYALSRHHAALFRTDVSTTIVLKHRLPFAELRRRGEKKALKHGVTFQQSTDYRGYQEMLTAVLKARHDTTPVHTAEELTLLASRFPKDIALHTAEKDGVILAGVLMFEYETVAHAQYIAASSEGRDVGALDALFSHLIQTRYAEKTYFDFGISTEEAGTVLNEGLIGQKEGFGGRSIVHQFFELTWTN